MHCVVTCDHTNEVLASYELAPHDSLELRPYAQAHCESMDCELAPEGGAIPLGCADFTVTLTEYPEESATCWNCESFFYA